ncbi:DNA-binding LacI/PurR family transcriptional regulator [Nakamurella sp. UYEF19]
MAVTGFDGIEAGRLVRPRITTVAQPMTLMGRTAVDMLLQRVVGADTAVIARTLPVEVLVRESCGCSAPIGRG